MKEADELKSGELQQQSEVCKRAVPPPEPVESAARSQSLLRGSLATIAPTDTHRPTPIHFESIPPPESHIHPVELNTEVFASGMNGALQRWGVAECTSFSLLDQLDSDTPWKPKWPSVKTFGLTFPDGVEFLPVQDAVGGTDADSRQTSGPFAVARASRNKPRKATRLKPPSSSLSIVDRLFYVLQPPLETLLSGQELIMPFEPFPFQYQGIGWLITQESALLADEMGLGKTMQTITALRLLLRSGHVRRVLLVCPKPLIPNWQREFKLWAEELPTITIEGNAARRRMLWTRPDIPIRIANYELMVRDFEMLEEDELPSFDVVVLDEAQRVKNRNSLTAQSARSIPRKRSWALTGTPIENRPEELASLFEFIEVTPPRSSPDLRQLKRLSNNFILRRTKDRVMQDLPPRLDRDEYLDLTSAQERAYHVAEKQGIVRLDEMGDAITIQHVFELVLRLKQITNFDPLTGQSAKFERLAAEMEEIAASGAKAILFSQWTRCLDWIAERLQQYGVLVYHGGVSTKKREPILQQFKDDPDCHLLLMSYGAGAVGLNLQCASYVFLFDRWWNPAVEDQAINRAHRIGQQNSVTVTRFISRNTIEERIDQVLRQKRELFAYILDEGSKSSVSLSLNAEEIFGLFDLKTRHDKPSPQADPNDSQSAAA